MASRDGAWKGDAKIAAGVDSNKDTHPLNCDLNGTLEVVGIVSTIPTTITPVSIDQTHPNNHVEVTNFPATQPVSGSVSVGNFPASQAVTGTFWQTTQPVSGSVAVSSLPALSVSTAAVTPVVVSPTVATLVASRAERVRVVIWNETGTLYVKAGSGASSSSYTWRLTANVELDITDYTGIVTATKATGTSTCLVTDF
jgi:hypothetical protein